MDGQQDRPLRVRHEEVTGVHCRNQLSDTGQHNTYIRRCFVSGAKPRDEDNVATTLRCDGRGLELAGDSRIAPHVSLTKRTVLFPDRFSHAEVAVALTINGLSKTYPNGVKALKNLSLSIG